MGISTDPWSHIATLFAFELRRWGYAEVFPSARWRWGSAGFDCFPRSNSLFLEKIPWYAFANPLLCPVWHFLDLARCPTWVCKVGQTGHWAGIAKWPNL